MTGQALEAAIVAKGNEIRQLKGEKKDFQTQLGELKKLKDEFKTATGQEYKAPAAAPKPAKAAATDAVKADGEKSKSQLKKEKKLAEKAAASASAAPKDKPASKKPAKPSATAKPVDATSAIPSGANLVMRQAKYAHHTSLHGASSGQTVTPWEVEAEGGVDYEKLIDTFGCSTLTEDLVARVERLTGVPAHRYLRRGYFFAHREFNEILDLYENGQKFYLYTGRGPSSGSLHLGHLIPFTFTAWLQKVFDVPLVIQLTDDEKFLFKDQTLEESEVMAWENSKDIIACGFDPAKTFIFRNADYIGAMYPEILKIQKCVTYNQVRGIFGFSGSDNIGKSAFPAVQACPSFPQTFPVPFSGRTDLRCLIPCAIDQDPYFRMTRDVAPRIGYQKPTLIFSKFFPALQGASTKMSGSNASATIYISDADDVVADKIRRFAFSGGGETKADHEKYGANLDVDIPFQYLTFMLEDDAELAHLAEEYGSGRMMSGVVKDRLIQVMTETNAAFQAKRAAITDDQIREFMRVRPLEF
ncbi:tryptophan-tRNA ligase [Aphanomyces astaci]|uniref:Tryptophan--tRNA ligase, cytoplasmic n=1 Tax=Aphanomyces astaci TaxID=112090 RepID=W4G613_APHAT|nr:tryptophan-tRNA ligase [Aphanomyces astaci]ETV74494.1 tryptophan-tRNA ligase [Aphanomyces astaci]|eukprot:XP_009836152.1 tryptophan-tRNA ligase [Aphanomyces astaci]